MGNGIVRQGIPDGSVLEIFSDADWSGCKKTRRSVSSAVIALDAMVLFSSSRTQKSVSLSSAESDYHSLVSSCADSILLRSCIGLYPQFLWSK